MKLKYYTQFAGANAVTYTLFRVAFGILLVINGWNKWSTLPDISIDFPDPLGVGSAISVYLTIFAELVCGLAIILGLVTRLTGFPVIVTFIVAVFMVHFNDPFDMKQAAILYLVTSIYITIKGSGSYSLDNLIWSAIQKRRSKNLENTPAQKR